MLSPNFLLRPTYTSPDLTGLSLTGPPLKGDGLASFTATSKEQVPCTTHDHAWNHLLNGARKSLSPSSCSSICWCFEMFCFLFCFPKGRNLTFTDHRCEPWLTRADTSQRGWRKTPQTRNTLLILSTALHQVTLALSPPTLPALGFLAVVTSTSQKMSRKGKEVC